jgi:hypothetical protein
VNSDPNLQSTAEPTLSDVMAELSAIRAEQSRTRLQLDDFVSKIPVFLEALQAQINATPIGRFLLRGMNKGE